MRLPSRSFFVFVLLVVSLVFIVRIPPVLRMLEPLAAVSVRLGTALGGFIRKMTTSPQSLEARLVACEEDRRVMAVNAAELASARREAEEFAALLGYTETSSRQGIAAQIIARAPNVATEVRMNRGSDDGIVLGSAVVISNGQLFGIVTEVLKHTASIRMVQNEESRIPAMIFGGERTIGLLEGNGGALLTMTFIPNDSNLSVGDVVVTSGLAGELPQNIVIGTVASLEKDATLPFQTAFISLLYDPREWVSVLVLAPTAL